MPRGGATAYGSSFVCVCVCVSLRLLCQFCSARSTVSIETYNVSRTRYYLAFEHLKVSYEALFSSYGVIFLPWFTLIAVAGDPDFSKVNTVHSCLPSSL